MNDSAEPTTKPIQAGDHVAATTEEAVLDDLDHGVTHPEVPFERDQIAQFDADDQQAGRAIGKMLSGFFLYTIVVMSLAALWTWMSMSGAGDDSTAEPETPAATAAE